MQFEQIKAKYTIGHCTPGNCQWPVSLLGVSQNNKPENLGPMDWIGHEISKKTIEKHSFCIKLFAFRCLRLKPFSWSDFFVNYYLFPFNYITSKGDITKYDFTVFKGIDTIANYSK